MAYRYELIRDYAPGTHAPTTDQPAVAGPGDTPRAPAYVLQTGNPDRTKIDYSPDWLVAVIPAGPPVTYDRTTGETRRVDDPELTRDRPPLLISDDVVGIDLACPKGSHVKTGTVQLRGAWRNYLDGSVVAPGDWCFIWITDNREDAARVEQLVRDQKPANGFRDGLKFVGRVAAIRRSVRTPASGETNQSYSLQVEAFGELASTVYYDYALASSAAQTDLRKFMAQMGLRFTDLVQSDALLRAGVVKDNAGLLVRALVDAIIGRGLPNTINDAALSVPGLTAVPAPQVSREAPASYLIPRTAARLLGRTDADATKGGVHGYADILDVLVGTQQYSAPGFYPDLDSAKSTASRKQCPAVLKGTYVPVNLSYLNVPLWSVLNSYLNAELNEMYSALHVDQTGAVVPHLVVRQKPFSTDLYPQPSGFDLTRYLALPRWVVAPEMVVDHEVVKNDSLRCNFVHVFGAANGFYANKSVTNQLARNGVVFDGADVQAHGLRARTGVVPCSLEDQTKQGEQRRWMETIADWSFGLQHQLHGTLTCKGVQSPVAEGDNLEYDSVVYHIEGVHHRCSIESAGSTAYRVFTTSFELSRGLPADQTGAVSVPRYPGYSFGAQPDTRGLRATQHRPFLAADPPVVGDPDFGTDTLPGVTADSAEGVDP